MRYLLDTNVISDGIRPRPSAGVRDWLMRQSLLDQAISTLTLGEIHAGIVGFPDGQRKRAFDRWFSVEVRQAFVGRILPVTDDVALAWGDLTSTARRLGRHPSVVDGLLIATARVHHLALVTRNVRDCGGWGVEIVNPWEAER